MLNFQTGLSGLRASQIGLEIASNNIANADNPNYHRQDVSLTSRTTPQIDGRQIGSGVEVDRIRRAYNSLIENALTTNINQQSGVDQELDLHLQIESILSPGTGSLQSQVESLFNELTTLTANPADPVNRSTVLHRAEAVVQELSTIANRLADLKSSVDHRIRGDVEYANQKIGELAEINKQLQVELSLGRDGHQLKDARAKTIKELAEVIDVEEFHQVDSPLSVLLANGATLVNQHPPELRARYDDAGNLRVHATETGAPLTFGGGRLQALSFAASDEIPRVHQQINDLAGQLAFVFDKTQSTGFPISGPHTNLQSSRSIADSALPINQANPQFPIGSGQLAISVTDLATGEHSLQSVNIDGDVDSLNDIAASISGVDHLQAIVGVSGELSIVAASGFAFDFAGRTETTLDASGLTGTASPSLSGVYSGQANDQFNYQFVGTGTVGVTAGLRLQVTNRNGEPVADLNVGNGYVSGSKLSVGAGIEISLQSGTVNDGEGFSSQVVSDSDETNLLVALGLGTFFNGNTASTLKVSEHLLANPDLLATSRSGDPADSGNVLRLLANRDAGLEALGGATLETSISDLVRETATTVQRLEIESSDLDLLNARLESEQAATIGVDPNEEFVRLIQFQKAFESSARIIAVADENMQTLLGLIR